MTALWTHETAQAATGGQAVGAWAVSGLSIDSRTLEPGQLFVPLKDIRDGHDFIPAAYAKGAGAVLSEHPVSDVPALIVPDSLQALENLAIAARKRSSATRIAVTGSVGKTSVKEMIANMCRVSGNTHASIKSYNNHWGAPLTLAGMAPDTQYGVFEMGMNHAGELADLTGIVRPDIAVITKIAPAHLAHFKDIEAIAQAKAEILSGLVNNGVAILPRDSAYYSLLTQQMPENATKIASFGWHKKADVRILETRLLANASQSVMRIAGRTFEVELPVPGKHWVENAACSLLVGRSAGLKLEDMLISLKNFKEIQGRGEVNCLSIAGKNIHLTDESYNANPESMAAAIAVLGLSKGRKIAVLGDMLELGNDEAALHAQMLGPLQEANIDLVATCGQRMRHLSTVLPQAMQAGWYADHAACLDEILPLLEDGDALMVKGSNASGMSKLVAALKRRSSAKNNNNKKDCAHVL